METIGFFGQLLVTFTWLAMLIVTTGSLMYAIGKWIQAIVLRRRVNASVRHEWDTATEALCTAQRDKQVAFAPRFDTLPSLRILTDRADRERTERIANDVMRQVGKHHDRPDLLH